MSFSLVLRTLRLDHSNALLFKIVLRHSNAILATMDNHAQIAPIYCPIHGIAIAFAMQSELRSERVRRDDKQGRKTGGKIGRKEGCDGKRGKRGTGEKRSHKSARGSIDLNHPPSSFLLLSASCFPLLHFPDVLFYRAFASCE